MLVLCTCK